MFMNTTSQQESSLPRSYPFQQFYQAQSLLFRKDRSSIDILIQASLTKTLRFAFFLSSTFLFFFSVIWQGLKNHLGKFRWGNAGKLLTLGLAAQVTAAQATGSNATKPYFKIGENIADNFSLSSVEEELGKTFVTNTSTDLKILPTFLKNWAPKINNSKPVKIDAAFENQGFAYKTAKVLTLANGSSDIFDIATRNHFVEISDRTRQEILRQFDRINTNLQQMTKSFDNGADSVQHQSNHALLSRVIRSHSVRRTQCTMPKDKLTELNNVISNALSNANGSQTRDTNCEISNISDTCYELVKLIQCGVNHLQNGFLKATADRASFAEFVILKNKFDEVSKKYANVFDDARMSVTQEHQREIDKLKTDYQRLATSFIGVVNELKEKTVRFCISEISSGKIESALEDFKGLKDYANYAVLNEIIGTTYNSYGRWNIIDNIFEFIEKLPWLSHRAISYKKLFEEMKKTGDSNSPNILILAYKVQQTLDKPNNIHVKQESDPELQKLKIDIAREVDQIIDPWAASIRNQNDYEKVKEFAKKNSDIFKLNLNKLVEMAYAKNLNNVESIFKFVRDLPYITQDIVAFSSLYETMKINNHLSSYQLVMLAFRVKECMEMDNYPNIDKSYKDKLTALKNNLPNSVVGLVWSDMNRCTIKSVVYDEFLYGASEWHNYWVFTWGSDPDDTIYWKLQTEDFAKSFSIKNTYYDMYLNGLTSEYDTERRYVALVDSLFNGWRIIPQDNKFLIFSPRYNEFLYADYNKYNANRRYVFRWIPGSIPESVKEERKWYISC